jgi:hypothetical protein
MACEDGAAGGAGFDEPHRKARRRLDPREAAAREHQEQWAAHAGSGKLAAEISEIGRDQRLQVGVGARGREALVFAHLRRDLARERHRNARKALGKQGRDAHLMTRLREAVEEPDCHRLDPLALDLVNGAVHVRLVERDQHAPARIDALAHRKAQAAWDERRRQIDADVVLLEAVLVADLDGVTKPQRRDQRGSGALALDERVGGERRAVNDDRKRRRREGRLGEHGRYGREHAALGRIRDGENLAGEAPAAALERDIREGPSDIDAETVLHEQSASYRLCSRRDSTSEQHHSAASAPPTAPWTARRTRCAPCPKISKYNRRLVVRVTGVW